MLAMPGSGRRRADGHSLVYRCDRWAVIVSVQCLRDKQQREDFARRYTPDIKGSPQGSPIEGGEQLRRCGNQSGILLTQQLSTAE